jgi:hypothetical protein
MGAFRRPDFPLNAPTDLQCTECGTLRHDYPGRVNNSFEHTVCRNDNCYHINLVIAPTCGNPKCGANLPNNPIGKYGVYVGRTKCLATFLSKLSDEEQWLCTKGNRVSSTDSRVCRGGHGNKASSKKCDGIRGHDGISVVRLLMYIQATVENETLDQESIDTI